MEVLIFILIVVFFAVSDKKNKQKKGQAAGRPRNAAEAQALAKAQVEAKLRAARARQAAEAKPAAEARPAVDVRPAAKAPGNVRPVKVASQQSPVFMAAKAPSLLDEIDEEGCVGGSMAHTHDEGESREEHRRHMESALKRETEEALATQAAVELEAVNLQRLRQAVIMAEVLDRPKALRRVR